MTTPGKRLLCGFGTAPGAGEPTTWYDITAYTKAIHVRSGASLDLNRIEGATLSAIVDNTDGRFTPLQSASPYYPYVRPMTPIRCDWGSDNLQTPFTLGVSHLGQPDCTLGSAPLTSNGIFRGLVSSWRPRWYTARGGYVEIQAVDVWRYLTLQTLKAVSFPQQTVGQRISAVLTAIGSTWFNSIDHGGITVKATSYTGTALDHMRAMCVLDGGVLYPRGDGAIVFNSYATAVTTSTWYSAQAVFGENGGSEIPYLGETRGGLQPAYDEQYIENKIDGKTSGGAAITTVIDATSQTNYMIRPSDFGSSDAVNMSELQNRAQWELVNHKDPRLRVDSVAFELLDPAVNSSALIALDIMQRVTLNRRPDQGAAISQDLIVQGFDHDILPDSWEMRVIAAPAPPAAWILGASKLDTTTLLL